MNQRPNGMSSQQSSIRPTIIPPSSFANDAELKLFVKNFPPGWKALEIFRCLESYGVIVRIEVLDEQRERGTDAYVTFSPPPRGAEWIRRGIDLASGGSEAVHHVEFSHTAAKNPFRQPSPLDPRKTFPDEIRVTAQVLKLGVMEQKNKMLVLHTLKATPSSRPTVVVNLHRKCLDINFTLIMPVLPSLEHRGSRYVQRLLKICLNFAQINEIVKPRSDDKRATLLIPIDQPPQVFRKTDNVELTLEPDTTFWTERNTWYRQTDIVGDPIAAREVMTQLQRENLIIDVGRWLTYRLDFDEATTESPQFREMCQALQDFDITIKEGSDMTCASANAEHLWSWLDHPTALLNTGPSSSILSEMQQMAHETKHISFEVLYQLEACISHGVLHESNIDQEFMKRLSTMEPERAAKLLEKVSDEKERFYDPNDIFRSLMHKVSVVRRNPPVYCATIRTATVTPTTIYFMSPVLETSNRVIRRFRQYEDRFLRVKFTDEKYKGKVMGGEDAAMNELFTRIKRTMTNGIKVGDRHYEFLAFGNAQFREHGAYFFASTTTLTAQGIRETMGKIHDKVVAKYCSRIGQCFSTTRAINIKITIEKEQDIERNGFCFTDGIGRISPFLARWIAQEYGLPNSETNHPSAFQFRLGGCKGVLVVDHSLTKDIIRIRPSQEKFSAMQHRGLEICRISQFSASFLNVQLILVLSALGVDDNIFLSKMKHMLRDLQEAMSNGKKALELLQKNVDYNHMTVQLASMVLDGFMETEDPFVMSCLRLWRSWSIKYLKEKARIFVEKGAFVLGCIDETATLKGHFEHVSSDDQHNDPSLLPEIFLQIPDPECNGKWKIIEGICALARNPSLHPGDVRVVRAVNEQKLHHLKNCVVFPQTGDRDLANMCSGGDLDGDDFLIMWDEELMPSEWNHRPMDYTAPPPIQSEGPVTVDAMTSFFVTHMKHDNLSRIAVAHKYWADFLSDGVKDPICLELAQLHSTAVDYAKTGVPAHMPNRLRPKQWPHWSQVRNKPKKDIYTSRKVLGRLYDAVQHVGFEPAWQSPFDDRILSAFKLSDDILQAAKEMKEEYDGGVRRIMAKFGIKNEFEVWTTFVMDHNEDIGDYKFAEIIGEAVGALKDHQQKLCYEKAGTTDKERDWSKMGPFIAAMYTVTAREVRMVDAEYNQTKLSGGRWVPLKERTVQSMPFMSFPWLFPAELGRIATKRPGFGDLMSRQLATSKKPAAKKKHIDLLSDGIELEPLPEVYTSEGVVREGDLLDLFHKDDEPAKTAASDNTIAAATNANTSKIANVEFDRINGARKDDFSPTTGAPPRPMNDLLSMATPAVATSSRAPRMSETDQEDEDEGEAEVVTIDSKPSALDALEKLLES